MSIELVSTNRTFVEFRVTGQVTQISMKKAHQICEKIIQENGKVSILIVTEDFCGWEDDKDWGDTEFSDKNDAFIEKIALVGKKEWRDSALIFTLKGLRPVPIEYFEPHQETQARLWLESCNKSKEIPENA